MATLFRGAILKVTTKNGSKIAACAWVQQRNIAGKSLQMALPPPPPKPAPFDYQKKDYTYLRSLFDKTTRRFDDNTKVILVEGPVAAGKTCFAQALAADLGMKHFEEPNMDFHYIMPNGLDIRMFDDQVPEDTRTFDHVNFNICPTHRNAAAFQMLMYNARLSQYVDALTHLFNTGQGVVLERSPFSDFVFIEAMYKCNYIRKEARSVYYDVRFNTIEELMRPHLVIYLDLPVDSVKQAITCRSLPHEVKGTALTPEYLTEMERQYKDKYLRDISTHAELLVYDWTGGGEVEVVVEDIERIDFDKYTEREEPKMKDWRIYREIDWADKRMYYTNSKDFIMDLFDVPRIDVPELIINAEDAMEHEKIIFAHPEFEFLHGYNQGFMGRLFKNDLPKYTIHI